ncbi:MAG: cyclase family protein [Pirellulaceae bacterium]|jgi:kynurenine formamidase|nr:cyclase family protein [Pirellulaceae bacterium]MDP7015962.1 cyclase family protein [Pirellulaceae bacterium]
MKVTRTVTTLLIGAIAASLSIAAFQSAGGAADDKSLAGWRKGVGWGWIWGREDEVGALNALNESTILAALQLAKKGKVYDLGITYNRESYKWPGHCPCEVMTFRTPEGEARQKDNDFVLPGVNPSLTRWHSCALFISDNVATQIDGLAHVTVGKDNHWYNGFKESDWGGDFGVRKCDATTIPPVVARGVMLDIAAAKGVDVLAAHYAITPADIDAARQRQKVELRPGDVVLLRTGTLRFWGDQGADHDKIAEHDSAGINLASARYLVEQFGAIMIGSDTSGLEVAPAPEGAKSFIPVHKYLLVEQGVHIAEFHYLEDLAKAGVSEFCYVGVTNKIKGATAGFTMRPLAIR